MRLRLTRLMVAELAPDEWTLDPAAYGFENMLVVDDGHYESDEGSFDYMLVLRPWGTDWSDVEAAAPALLPYFYNDWYVFDWDEGTRTRYTDEEFKEKLELVEE